MPQAPSFPSLNRKKRMVGDLKNKILYLNFLVYDFDLDEMMQKWINFNVISFVCFVHANFLPSSCVFWVKSMFWTARPWRTISGLLRSAGCSTKTARPVRIRNTSQPNFATNQKRLYIIRKRAHTFNSKTVCDPRWRSESSKFWIEKLGLLTIDFTPCALSFTFFVHFSLKPYKFHAI